ncbi:MAG: hypothetical protein Q9195_009355 [Heterodermia aff. obscurata]
MYFTTILFLAALSLAAAFPQHYSKRNLQEPIHKFTTPRLNITTLAGNRRNESVIECWTVATLSVSSTPGIQGALIGNPGNPSAINYFNIPAQFNGGLHNAPVVQYVWFTSGAAVISLPASNDTATVEGGSNGLILATDIAAVSAQGHTTVYPSKERTIGLVVALANNTVPVHTVIHSGACTEADGLDYLNEELD